MSESMWDFPPGAVSHDQSVKGYRAEAKDGHAGEVSGAVYAPAGTTWCLPPRWACPVTTR